jgi:tRNA/tmRNA/rRNA uracil-C5-methylase (TrmA/RlmC/RlmD family)
LDIESIAFGGNGIGRIDGKVVFVPGTLPGENVKIKIISGKKNYSVAELEEIIKPSPHRITPSCPYIARQICPGCSYRHADYDEEVRIKNSQFRDMLEKDADISPKICLPPVKSPKPDAYRNKITFHVSIEDGQCDLGYFMSDNRTILDIEQCPLANEKINNLLMELRSNKSFKHTLKDKMTVTFRHTENDGVSFWRNNPGKKESWLKENTILGSISVPKGSFFQVNPECADILISKVMEMTEKIKPEEVIDLYCGVGIFSIAASKNCSGKITGIDSNADGIEAARYNAKTRNLDNCEFIAERADRALGRTLKKIINPNSLLIVDPPRTGLDKTTATAIENSGIKSIIYISCAPDTLCRDLKNLIVSGYKVISSQMIDMFPRTSHFESVTFLERV